MKGAYLGPTTKKQAKIIMSSPWLTWIDKAMEDPTILPDHPLGVKGSNRYKMLLQTEGPEYREYRRSLGHTPHQRPYVSIYSRENNRRNKLERSKLIRKQRKAEGKSWKPKYSSVKDVFNRIKKSDLEISALKKIELDNHPDLRREGNRRLNKLVKKWRRKQEPYIPRELIREAPMTPPYSPPYDRFPMTPPYSPPNDQFPPPSPDYGNDAANYEMDPIEDARMLNAMVHAQRTPQIDNLSAYRQRMEQHLGMSGKPKYSKRNDKRSSRK